METQAAHTSATTDHLLRSVGFEIDDWPGFVAGCEQSADLFERMFSNLVPTEFSVQINEVVPGMAAELIDVSQPYLSSVLRAENWDARLLARTPLKTAFSVSEGLFGGDGSVDSDETGRECTQVEIAAVEMMFRYLAAALQSSFAKVADPKLVPGVCTRELELDSVGGGESSIVLVRFAGELLKRPIEISVAIAQRALVAVGEPLQGSPIEKTDNCDPKWSQHFDKHLRRTDVRLTAILDGGKLTLDEISRLCTGQVLELPTGPESLVKVDCNGHPSLWCQLGQSEGQFVLRVEQFADAEQDFMDELLTAEAIGASGGGT